MKTAQPSAKLSVVPSHAQSSGQHHPQGNTQITHSIGMLRAVLGSLQDGFIIASQTGEIHQINQPAERICDVLTSEARSTQSDQLPTEIWNICRSLLKNQALLKNQNVPSIINTGLDADIIMPNIGPVRIRVQNIVVADAPCLLIVLEDRQQTIRNKALSDAALYGLTEREAEIWQMRLRGAAYKEISTALWISVDTVKKHVKNILAKQRSHQDELEYALMA